MKRRCASFSLLLLLSVFLSAQETKPGSTGMAAQVPIFAGSAGTFLACNAMSNRLSAINDSTGEFWYCYGGTWKKLAGPVYQTQDFQFMPSLFATNTATGSIYYEPNAVTIRAVVSREQGSPTCTAAPVLTILDLGTSASTAYASATVLYSQTLSTSNTVVANTGLSVAVAAGHYIGAGFSAGACVSAPTISTTITLQ